MKNVLDQIKSFPAQHLWRLIVLLGIFLRLRQYFANRSLWVDEASLALNIVDRTFGGLILPLDYDQGAPIGFLFIVKFLSLIFGNHDYILRLFPLLSGILATYLIYRIASQYFGRFGMVAALLFSISDTMVYYSSEFKQYSSDVMVVLLLAYLALRCVRRDSQQRDIILLGLAGVLSIWMSHPSVFVLSAIGLLLVAVKILEKEYRQVRWLIGAGVMWGGSFLTTYLISLRHLTGNDNLQDYWRNNYAPLPPWDHLDWYRNLLVTLLPSVSPSFLQLILPNFRQDYLIWGCLLLIFIGILSLSLRSAAISFLVIFPILAAFLASALRQYPMSDRFLFFWFPSLLFLMAEGLRRIYSICIGFSPKAAAFTYGFMVLIILWTPLAGAYYTALHPPMGEDIKPILAYIRENARKDDIIYVHNGSVTPFLFYAPSYEFKVNEIFIAKKSWNFKRFTIDVMDFQGSDRIWFIFSHVVSCDCDGHTREDRIQAHIQLLNNYGVQLDHFEASKAAVYLYDLSP